MDQKLISWIIRIGTVVFTTVASFIVDPPVIAADNNSGIQFNNIAVFFAGILSIYLFDKFKKPQVLRKFTLIMLGFTFLLFIGYQWMYIKCSINCWSDQRIIVSSAQVKPSVRKNFDYWKKHAPNDPLHKLTEAFRCSSVDIWEMSDLAVPYYVILVLYLLILISFILLVLSVSDLVKPDTPPQHPVSH